MTPKFERIEMYSLFYRRSKYDYEVIYHHFLHYCESIGIQNPPSFFRWMTLAGHTAVTMMPTRKG